MAMNGKTIVVAGADLELLTYLETVLLCEGCRVIKTHDCLETLYAFREQGDIISAVVLDIGLHLRDGLEILLKIRERDSEVPVIVVSSTPETMQIVEVMKAGASNYLAKPVVPEHLLRSIGKLATGKAVGTQTVSHNGIAKTTYLYASLEMERFRYLLAKAAAWDVPVILRGESGVGKEVLEHQVGKRLGEHVSGFDSVDDLSKVELDFGHWRLPVQPRR